MEFRYLGFEQSRNARTFGFDVTEKGQPARHFSVTADMALFLTYHVAFQEGPSLSAAKLAADLEHKIEGVQHELTLDDLRSHSEARIAALAERAASRKPARRRIPTSPATASAELAPGAAAEPSGASAEPVSHWKNFRI
jgi:hypothetical protein